MDGLKCEKDHFLYDKHKVLSLVSALAQSSMLNIRSKVRCGWLGAHIVVELCLR